MLEIKGELVFKTVAYHRAADAIGRSPVDLVAAYRAGNPPQIPGVGQAISDKIAELATTGHMAYLRAAAGRGPAEPRRAAADPGPRAEDGPPAPRASSGSRRSTTSQAAAEAGRLADDPRACPQRTEALDPRGHRPGSSRPVDRMLLEPGRARDRRRSSRCSARRPASGSIEPAGSFRRRKETIGDLDLLAETDRAGGADRRVHRARRWSTRSSTGAATRRPSGCCAGRRST